MKQDVLQLFNNYPHYALLLSIGLNILIAVLGVVPSVFLTAANVLFFGFWPGTIISIAGESFGAFIAFVLYRSGFKKRMQNSVSKYPAVERLIKAEGKEAFYGIVSLRLIPFVPSGIVTFAAAIGKVRPVTFLIASTLGKVPALLIEAYAAYQVTAFGWQGKVILLIVGLYLLYLVIKKLK